MEVQIHESWKSILEEEFQKPYFENLASFLKLEKAKNIIYPPGSKIFNAFERCTCEKVEVVIIGQDPYHGAGQANGLAFSVNDGITLPPSLRNIFKEIKNDLGKEPRKNGSLESWADQGVLLLNATLTVRAGSPGSHQKKGWEEFTDAVIRKLCESRENLVIILWGAYAQKKGSFIDEKRHLVIKSAHPSPFSADRGFFGSKPFSKTNEYLIKQGKKPIDW